MRVAIVGNSGSGKSTLAHWLAGRSGAPVLDLDTVAWEANQNAVARSMVVAERDVRSFCQSHESWLIEGCYANLVSVALQFDPRLVFLNPGEARCLTNCSARPWEPHKYSSRSEQDKRLPFLLSWVSEYYTRDGETSMFAHTSLFATYRGLKCELTVSPSLDQPSDELLAWTR